MSNQPEQSPEGKKPINRREFLNLAWLASLGFLTLNIAGVGYLFAMPRFKAGEFGGVVDVGTVSSLPEAGSAPENMPRTKIWLSNTEEGVIALYKVCTHLGCLYNWNNQEVKFICPCHGSQFQADGQYIHGPAPRSLDRFVIRAVDPNSGDVLKESTYDPMPLDNIPPDAIIQVDTGDKVRGLPHA
jgi:cytochrome b6-f complex iron-sulfur subunit